MEVRELGISGAFEFTPTLHQDQRGLFTEWYRFEPLEDAVGHRLELRQANLSVSGAGVLRGVHFSLLPPSQAKYVTVMHGSVLDIVVDLRVGSPTFGSWESVRLDDASRNALYLAEGLGHAFYSLAEGTTVAYLVSEVFAPDREATINPLDPALGLPVPADAILSPRDAAAPTLSEARAQGILPTWEDSQRLYAELATR